ncbi:hypothetical protein [uncultured Flavobacterium sp.]|nr:hypothetical protein [uncultured Flavobacterium sp.]
MASAKKSSLAKAFQIIFIISPAKAGGNSLLELKNFAALRLCKIKK